MNLAEKLTIQRKKSGMSQEQLADRLGITWQSVSKWEAGSSIPEIAKLVTMSEIFHVSLDYLLKDYLDDEQENFKERDDWQKGMADGSDKDWLSKDNSRLEEKVDDIARYLKGYQYTSKTKIAGIPLVSIRFSRQLGRDGVAKGIIAIGNAAIGVVSLGAVSFGILSFGAAAVGILAIGALAAGIMVWGALAVGIFAFGAAAVGIYSAGVAALGKEIAVGVSAMGETAVGETARGTHCLLYERGVTTKVMVENFLRDTNPGLWEPISAMMAAFAMHI